MQTKTQTKQRTKGPAVLWGHFIREYGFGERHHLAGRTGQGSKEGTESHGEQKCKTGKEKAESGRLYLPPGAIYERKGKSRLTASSAGGLGGRESYVSRGRKIGYVMELAED